MARLAISMRWWLALSFAAIAALTAVAVAQFFSVRSESAIRERARELTAGSVVTAALDLSDARSVGELRVRAQELGSARRMAFFVLDDRGVAITEARARGIDLEALPNIDELRESALAGRRTVETSDDGRVIAVALPLRSGLGSALIGVSASPDLEEAVGIVQAEIIRAAIFAVGIAVLAGIAIATIITRRLRRIARAAAEIEQGRFDRELRSTFPDELGELAATIDEMRKRLKTSFDDLGDERDRLLRLLEQLQEGVIVFDRNLNVEFANGRAHELLALDLPAGTPVPDPWPELRLRTAAASVFSAGADVQRVRVHLDFGRTYVVALIPPTASSQAGLAVITDVTEHEQREWIERKFVMNAAHELRTPLAAIASAVEVLQGGAKHEPDERDRFLDLVERQTARLSNLTRSLLMLARAQTGLEAIRLDDVDVGELLDEISVAEGGPVAVRSETCCTRVVACAQRELLHQAITNLVSNAQKSASESIVLRAAHLESDRVGIAVADNGRGMSAEHVKRALDRFYRAPSAGGDGFGLGLPIVNEVVRAMDGSVSIKSAPGAGTTVTLVLKSASATRSCA